MFSHVMIGTNDLDRAKTFYDAVLGTLDIKPGMVDQHRVRSTFGLRSLAGIVDQERIDQRQVAERGVGAAVGAIGGRALARGVVRQAAGAFGPPPLRIGEPIRIVEQADPAAAPLQVEGT